MPPPAPRFASLLIALLVGGCSGTPFGETLSRSFSGGAPSAVDAPSAGPLLSPPTPEPLNPDAPRGGGQRPAAPAAKPGGAAPTVPAPARAAVAPTASSGPTPPALRPPANPAPYRVTILLPQADPAAPAEVVTRALRSAGVPFEVETIQRTAPGEAPRPATPSPAATTGSATPAAPAAPSVRPALPPR
jgi:hypothetical protein